MTINNNQLNIFQKIVETVIQKCPFVSKQTKIDSRIKTVFPGHQDYGNCGIEASRQLVELTTCKQISQQDALREAVNKDGADLIFNDPQPTLSSVQRKTIINNLGNKEADAQKGININHTGGTNALNRRSFINRNGGKMGDDGDYGGEQNIIEKNYLMLLEIISPLFFLLMRKIYTLAMMKMVMKFKLGRT